MKKCVLMVSSMVVFLCINLTLKAETFVVNSQSSFDDAHDDASANDSIIWEPGIFSDIYMDIGKSNLYIGAQELGGTVFTGSSMVNISSDYVTLEGLQFVDGNIGTEHVIYTTGSYNLFTQLNIRAYTSHKYLIMREECRFNVVSYCNFENRLNQADQNILSVLVDENQPGYSKVQYCSFKNFAGGGNDEGVEPIRIGVSTQADFISRTLVEHCYFTNCDGDGELISNKARQNVFRYNTFENNSKAELVLRHGAGAVVYSNFFLNGYGGVRVREGQDHFIFNNYFSGLTSRSIYLQNEDSDPLDNITIAYNTIIDCAEVRLGGSGSNDPTNVTFANNIFADPKDDLFEDRTNTETWIGNIYTGSLGISVPSQGLVNTNPQLEMNSAGYFGLADDSPAIDAALTGFPSIPTFPDIDIDNTIMFDIMKQVRPVAIVEKDLGCSEYPHNVLISPIATEENTGPSYNTDFVNAIDPSTLAAISALHIFPNPIVEDIYIQLDQVQSAQVRIDLFDSRGKKILKVHDQWMPKGEQNISVKLADLLPGVYLLHFSESSADFRNQRTLKVVKL